MVLQVMVIGIEFMPFAHILQHLTSQCTNIFHKLDMLKVCISFNFNFFNNVCTFKSAVFGWTFTFCRRPFGVKTFTTLPLIVITLLKFYTNNKHVYAEIKKEMNSKF